MFTFLQSGFRQFVKQTSTIKFGWHFVLAVVAFCLLGFTNAVLDESYAASQFPVPYFEGQTTFSGVMLKQFYGSMQAAGTLPIYWRTQLIDFGFITAVILTGLLLPSFVARLHKRESALYFVTMGLALLMALGGVFDIVENLISFVMLAQPQTFPNWLALPYSTAAVLKFACMITAVFGTLLSLLLAPIMFLWRRIFVKNEVTVQV